MKTPAAMAVVFAVFASTSAMAQNTGQPADPATGATVEKTVPPPSPTADAAPTDQPAVKSPELMSMSDAEAKAWVDKTIYSSDGKNVGEVAAIARDASGTVSELHADVGGFLGLGETRVRVLPSEFKIQGDKIVLAVAAEQVKALPHLTK